MKNEIGNRYGKLLVIKKVPRPENRPKGAYWVCQCDCGNYKVIRGADLRSGHVNSCGCLYGQHSVKNEIGNKYGRLIVIERAEKQGSRGVLWKCQCNCGNIVIVSGGDLRSGSVQSCGCLAKERSRETNLKDLTGQRFGKLTILSLNKNETIKNKATFWNCKCDCGNNKIIRGQSLKTGAVKSCGCIKSIGEMNISLLLKDLNIPFIKEYRIYNNNKYYKFDFAIIDINNNVKLFIEYDGIQHFGRISGWFTEERKQQLEKSDNFKNNYCKEHNIPLIRIPYWELNNINKEYLLNKIQETTAPNIKEAQGLLEEEI